MALPPVEQTGPVDHADPALVTAVVEAARAASPVVGATVVVAVDGRSGSGKTLLGTAVTRALACPVVHLDEVYPGWDGLEAGDDLVTTHVLEPLARDRDGETYAPHWDRWAAQEDAVYAGTRPWEGADLVLHTGAP